MAVGTKELIRGYPREGYEGGITFAGLAYEMFDDKENPIHLNWSPDSWNTIVNYVNTLIENLHQNKPLRKMDDSDMSNLFDRLSKRDNERYAFATLNNIGYWYYRIYKEGVRKGYYDDVTYCSDYYTTEKSGDDFLVKVKRSFTAEEEYRIFKELYKSPEQITGEELGLLLMFLCAFRENEVCAIDYKDIRQMLEYPDVSCIWIYETTVINSSQKKPGAKTKNGNRVILIYDFLRTFLAERRAYLQKLVDSGEIKLVPEYRSVDDLPVVCIGNNFKRRSPTKYLIHKGNDLFKKLKIEGVSLSELFREMKENNANVSGVIEKEPTTYLLRRNRGTSLYNVGLEMHRIQYYLGHDIEDPYYCRNVLSTERELIKIKDKLDSLPVNGFADMLSGRKADEKQKDNSSFKKTIPFDDDCEAIKIKIYGKEPGDPISVKIKSDSAFDANVDYFTEEREYGRTVNISRDIWEIHKKG